MSLIETFRLSIEALLAHKFRTVLTILGMVVGVFSVVVLVSLGQGAKNYVLAEFQGLGTNLIIIQPGKVDKRGELGPPPGAAKRRMTSADVVALEKRAFNIQAVSGLVLGSGTVKYEDAVSNLSVFGVNEQFNQIITIAIGRGNFLSREECETGRRVVVLGLNIARNLFGNAEAVGRVVKVNESEFRVIAVTASMGNKLGINFDDVAFIPTRAAQRLFNDDKLLGIRAKASSRATIEDATAEIREILKARRDGEEDFTIITQVAMMDTLGNLLNMLSYLLGGIATISMLVGGIGIMNIMLVSVSERTQEIGIRRAVGARRRDILRQFLSEALALSLLSGGVGVGGAVALTWGVVLIYPTFDMRAPSWILLPAFLLAIVVGVIFGVWPARKASRIETLDALRYE